MQLSHGAPLQLGPQPLERPREARLDRARAHAERRRRLGLGELEQVAAADHRPVVLAQAADRVEQRGPALAGEERRLRGGGRLPGRARLARGAEGQRGPAAGRAAAVAGLVGHDREQPWPQRLAGAEAPERAAGLDQPLLRGVLRVRGVARDEVGGPEGDLLMAADERRERAGIPGAGTLDQLGLLQWPAHHRPFYTRWENPVPAKPDRGPRQRFARIPSDRIGSVGGSIRWEDPVSHASAGSIDSCRDPDPGVDRAADRPAAPQRRPLRRAVHPAHAVGGRADGARLRPRRDPADPRGAVRRCCAAARRSQVLEPFAGPSSILLTDGEEHLRARRLVLPPSTASGWRRGGRRSRGSRPRRWRAGRSASRCATLPRMQALTLDVILRVVLGAPGPRRCATAIRGALDLAQSLGRLAVLSLVPPGTPPWRRFERAVARVDALLLAAIRSRPAGGAAVIDELIAAGGERARAARPGRDAARGAGHETTAGSLAWACERLARHPAVQERLREEGDAYLAATVAGGAAHAARALDHASQGGRALRAGRLHAARRAPTSPRASTSRTGGRSCGGSRRRSGRSGSSARARRRAGCPSAAGSGAARARPSRRWSSTRCSAPSSRACGSRPTGPRGSGCAAAA